MNSKLREKVVNLRINEELSYSEIQKRFAIPKSTLSYWLKDIPLSKERIDELRFCGRKKAEGKIEKFRESMRIKKEKEEKNVYEKYLGKFSEIKDVENSFFAAGLMLYLGEGDKRNKNRVNLANTDPEIIRFFIKWVVHFFNIEKKKIRFQLHLYENMKIGDEENYWKKELDVFPNQLYKSQIRKLKKNSFSYSSHDSHGTCSLYISNTKLKTEIMMAIKAILKKFN